MGDMAPRAVPYPNPSLKDKAITAVCAADGYSIALTKPLNFLDTAKPGGKKTLDSESVVKPSLKQHSKMLDSQYKDT